MQAPRRSTLVFDESGDTGTRSIPESYSTAGIFCANEPDVELVTALDAGLRTATGLRDYKYKHVRENADARARVAAAFRRMPSTVLVVAIASISGGVATEELRFDAAVRGSAAGDNEAPGPERTRRKNLEYFTHGVAHASTGIAHERMQPLDVWWDRRSDLQRIEDAFAEVKDISTRLNDSGSDIPFISRAARANKQGVSVEFRGACDARTRPASRVAGIIASDILRVADAALSKITPLLRENDVLMSMPKARDQYFSVGGILVGELAEPLAKDSHLVHHMPLFRAYASRLAAGQFSIWEPSGRICHVVRLHGRWHILQVPD